MDPAQIPFVGMFLSLVVAPAIVFGFILLLRKGKNEVEKIMYKKEMMEIELRKEELHLKVLLEENKKYDRMN